MVLFAGALLGLWGFKVIGYDRQAGAPTYQIEGVVGPDGGPACSADERYVDEDPGGLRDDVLDAFRKLRAEAGRRNVVLCLQDGKRSTRQQQAQYDEYVKEFGSEEQARKYVLPPHLSNHVKGFAIDVQPQSSAAWVERSAGAYGWCRRYENEPWHFEYDPSYPRGCPPLLPHA